MYMATHAYGNTCIWQHMHMQGSSLTFSLAGQSGQPKSGLAGPQLVWLARDTFIGFGQPIIITIYSETETESQHIFVI